MTLTDPPVVSLRELTRDTVRAYCALRIAESQNRFVAPVAVSIAQAYFHPEAWFRGIVAGDEPVGFVMLSVKPEEPKYEVWRLSIDERFQRRGYGGAAMALVLDQCRAWGAREVLLSYVPGEGEPEPFYRKLGFTPTGTMDGDEIVMRIGL